MTRRFGLALGLVITLGIGLVSAQTSQSVVRYINMSVSSTQVAFTSAQLLSRDGRPVTACTGRLEGGDVRIGVRDIINPTTTVGQLALVGEFITVNGNDNLKRFLAIRTTADASIKWFCTAAS